MYKNMFLYEKTHRYLKNDYQFFDALKIKDRKIRENCNLLTKVKFHELEWSSLIPTINHAQNSLAAAEALSPKISSHGTSCKLKWGLSRTVRLWNISQMITKTIWISTRIVISHALKQGNLIRIFHWREHHWRTNTSVGRKKWIQKNRTTRVAVRDPNRKVKYLSKIIWDRKIITVHQVYQFHQNRLGCPFMMGVKVSRDKDISRWVDWENPIYIIWNRIKNPA